MSRRRFVGGLLGGGGLLALGCTSPTTSAPASTGPASSPPPSTTVPPTTVPPTTVAATTAPLEPAPYVPSTTWETVAPAAAGWDAARLEEVAAFAGARATRSLLLVDDGRIVAERYFDVEPTFRREVASCQKSVVSILVGMAQRRGLLAVDDAVTTYLGPGWTDATAEEEQRITIRHLLSMTSGLDGARRVVAEPGTVWSYNNDAYHQLQPVLEAVTTVRIDELCREWLWAPIGAADSSWAARRSDGQNARDARGVPLWGLTMSARDLARYGLLVQRDGVWGDIAVLDDPAYLQAALSASSEANPSYGYLWWLNGGATFRLGADGPAQPGPLIPGAPGDLVAALGKDDQKLYVSRSERLVLVRQGARAGVRSVESLSDFDGELWRLVLAARSA